VIRRAHDMPFGAACLAEGGVRFRLWAPGARQVDVRLRSPGGEDSMHPMETMEGGWYGLTSGTAGPGFLYSYRIDKGISVPDPASRFQPQDVHGPSEVVSPYAFLWEDDDWRGRPWEETVLYELHVGTFTPEGTFRAAAGRLDYLADLGVTAVELMPVADFPGARNWGYDGVLPFAPDSTYGRPEDLKGFVQAAHRKGMMVFLDVVYNHFGPEGNYLHVYARDAFFTRRHRTPWGDAINFDGPGNTDVREFFIHNALYWLEEFHMDGLRLDAVHAVVDDSRPDILEELADRVRTGPGRSRRVHLVLENDDNRAGYLKRDRDGTPIWYDAQWNDDIHHALHSVLTGEREGYYTDYAHDPVGHLCRCLAEGFAYQGEPSPYRNGTPRGESTKGLPPAAFVSFLQNHDQVGNRAFGERIESLAEEKQLRAAVALLLLAPSPPLLFMGEEFATLRPFPFFCDFGPELARSVTEGRRREFQRFPEFRDQAALERIPDPNDPATFESAALEWTILEKSRHRDRHAYYRALLALRRDRIVPIMKSGSCKQGNPVRIGDRGLVVSWDLSERSRLSVFANLGDAVLPVVIAPQGTLLFATGHDVSAELAKGLLLPWSAAWYLKSDHNGETEL